MTTQGDSRVTMGLVYGDDETVDLNKYRGYRYKAGDGRFFQSEAEIDEYIAGLSPIDISEWLGKRVDQSPSIQNQNG